MGMGSFRGGAGGRGQPAYSGVQRTRREDNLIGKSLFVAKGPYRQDISFSISFYTLLRTRREDNLIGKSLFVVKGPYRQDISLFVLLYTLEKTRKDYAFRLQFNEKPSMIPGCLGILCFKVWVVEPVVTHQTSWLESTGARLSPTPCSSHSCASGKSTFVVYRQDDLEF